MRVQQLIARPDDESFVRLTPTTVYYHTEKPTTNLVNLQSENLCPVGRSAYFEIEIIELVGEISIGLAPHFYRGKERLGDFDFSAGYFSTGFVVAENGTPKGIYDPWRNGDIIGCGLFGSRFFVTRNGDFECVGTPFFRSFATHFHLNLEGVGSKLKLNFDITKTKYFAGNLKTDLRHVRLPADALKLIFAWIHQSLADPIRSHYYHPPRPISSTRLIMFEV